MNSPIEYIEKPWGKYETYYRDNKLAMKKLIVNPKSRLSLQSHNGRNEIWVVLEGEAHININENTFVGGKDDFFIIQKNEKHRISNHHNTNMLIIAELAFGEVDENDIIRYQDDYKR